MDEEELSVSPPSSTTTTTKPTAAPSPAPTTTPPSQTDDVPRTGPSSPLLDSSTVSLQEALPETSPSSSSSPAAAEKQTQSKMRTVWVVRHGERLDNVDDNWVANTPGVNPYDPPLTDVGVHQASCTAAMILDERQAAEVDNPVTVLSSPFSRCLNTAGVIAEALGVPVRPENGLCEMLKTEWFATDPIPTLQPKLRAGCTASLDTQQPSVMTVTWPETLDQSLTRYAQSASVLLEAFPVGDLVFVTHGYGVQAMTEFFDNDAFIYQCEYCATTTACTEDGGKRWSVIRCSDHSHVTPKST
eukprot:TRINITY_DN61578_c0_g3_i3.p1 TRINITY_DN61578_c0_g3~~TRINITY_DN61578_c0_g3_i3.p1  ORF type:complete len:301 (-),score=41.04 TRINITY_DN61578_c0_g3_i3:80-982(-)